MPTSEQSTPICQGKVQSPLLCELLKRTHKRTHNDPQPSGSSLNEAKIRKLPISNENTKHRGTSKPTSILRELLAAPRKQLTSINARFTCNPVTWDSVSVSKGANVTPTNSVRLGAFDNRSYLMRPVNSAVVSEMKPRSNATIRKLLSLPPLDANKDMKSNSNTNIGTKENLPMQSIAKKDQMRMLTMPRHYSMDSSSITQLKLHQAYVLHKFAEGVISSKTFTQ